MAYCSQNEKNKAGVVMNSFHDLGPIKFENASLPDGDSRCTASGVIKKRGYTKNLTGHVLRNSRYYKQNISDGIKVSGCPENFCKIRKDGQ